MERGSQESPRAGTHFPSGLTRPIVSVINRYTFAEGRHVLPGLCGSVGAEGICGAGLQAIGLHHLHGPRSGHRPDSDRHTGGSCRNGSGRPCAGSLSYLAEVDAAPTVKPVPAGAFATTALAGQFITRL